MTNKRSAEENDFLTFDRCVKIKSTVEKYGEETFYISFSGGKDSTVLSHLVDLAIPGNRIPRVYAQTPIELNAVKAFVHELQEKDDRIEIIKPAVKVKEALERDGYPFKSKEHSMYVDIYQRNGYCKTIERYLYPEENRKTFGCPEMLRYQFTPEFNIKISKKCCYNMKERPLAEYGKSKGRPNTMIGLLGDEKGGRSNAKCLVETSDGLHFQPMTAVDSEWEAYFIAKENIRLCKLYYPPYNFERTGCAGCPYNTHLVQTLDALALVDAIDGTHQRAQVEYIWHPIYEEYRRLGYRLKRPGAMQGQMDLFEIAR